MELQAELWHKQRRLEEARSEALRTADVYGKLHQQNCTGVYSGTVGNLREPSGTDSLTRAS